MSAILLLQIFYAMAAGRWCLGRRKLSLRHIEYSNDCLPNVKQAITDYLECEDAAQEIEAEEKVQSWTFVGQIGQRDDVRTWKRMHFGRLSLCTAYLWSCIGRTTQRDIGRMLKGFAPCVDFLWFCHQTTIPWIFLSRIAQRDPVTAFRSM